MEVYAVFKHGVYRHECAGIFTTLDRAADVARVCIAAADDDYHSYVVVPFTLDAPTVLTPYRTEPGSEFERTLLASVERGWTELEKMGGKPQRKKPNFGGDLIENKPLLELNIKGVVEAVE